MSDTVPTITSVALALHTDLATIKTYADKSPAVVRALLAEARDKHFAIGAYLDDLRDEVGHGKPACPVAA